MLYKYIINKQLFDNNLSYICIILQSYNSLLAHDTFQLHGSFFHFGKEYESSFIPPPWNLYQHTDNILLFYQTNLQRRELCTQLIFHHVLCFFHPANGPPNASVVWYLCVRATKHTSLHMSCAMCVSVCVSVFSLRLFTKFLLPCENPVEWPPVQWILV
jgi:hypothetical protein